MARPSGSTSKGKGNTTTEEITQKRVGICCRCKSKDKTAPSNFYKTTSRLYTKNGYMPICKECLTELFTEYIDTFNDMKKAMKRLCAAFDMYYEDSLFENCVGENDTISGILTRYIKMINLVAYRDKSFNTSVIEGLSFYDDSENADTPEKIKNIKEKISNDDIKKWGAGLHAEDYESLNSHYKYLKGNNPNCDSNQETFINDLCFTKMQQLKAIREGNIDNYSKLTDLYRKTFQQAGLKATRDTSMNDGFTVGVTAETIEKYTPAEYYKNKELYRDYDNIENYIERFLLRPLRNLMHGSDDRDTEYYVKDEDEGEIDAYADEE